MFIGVTVINEDNFEMNITINVTNISTLEPVNPRNYDAGTYIYLKDSRIHETRTALDIIQVKINKAIERYGNQILVNYIAQHLPEPKKKRNVRKTDI